MTDRLKDGGPAFPREYTHKGHSGMSLRDWLAGQTLVAMGTWVPPVDICDSEGNNIPPHMPAYQRKVREARAEWAYAQADAVLAAREGKTND